MDETSAMKPESPPPETSPNLKTVREARGLTLQEIFETTRIGIENLAAVENGDHHRLPPPVYARNFIRKYAQAVGVDEKPLLARYERHLAGLKPPQEETEVRKPWPEAHRRYRFLFASLAAVIAAGILVSLLFLYDQAGNPSAPAPAVPQETAALPSAPDNRAVPDAPAGAAAPVELPQASPSAPEVPAPVPAAKPAAVPEPAARSAVPPAAAGKMHHLIIEARELTWIRITEDRNPSHQALLKPGDRMERMASDFFQLDIGNAGGINLTFQGKPLGSLGKSGQIIHLRLPEKGSERKTP